MTPYLGRVNRRRKCVNGVSVGEIPENGGTPPQNDSKRRVTPCVAKGLFFRFLKLPGFYDCPPMA